jgi:hypothetical protein
MAQKQSKRARLLAEVQAQGFDQSVISGSGVRVRCSQCEAFVINGIATHEMRCPNTIKYVACFNCGCDVRIGDACGCDEPLDDTDEQ